MSPRMTNGRSPPNPDDLHAGSGGLGALLDGLMPRRAPSGET